MVPEFWQTRWFEGRIGFHNANVNPLLIKYFSQLNLPAGSRVLVPLCGKSVDIVWLAQQGFEVIGIELVESAIQDFFTEHNVSATVVEPSADSAIKCYQATILNSKIELWVADIFSLTTVDIGRIDAVYDRAALIALPVEMRLKYSEHIKHLSHVAPQLLITLDYDQSKKEGPPFSISDDQLQQYYSADYQITELESQSSTFNMASELPVTEQVWQLKPKN